MRRRDLLAAALAAFPLSAARPGRDRLSVITDEIGTLDEAIQFAKHHRLKWLEIRAYLPIPDAELKMMRKKMDDAGIRVSFLNSALLKFTLPGTTAVSPEDFYENLYKKAGLTPEKLYAQREETLKHSIHSAQVLGVKLIRGFTFWRTDHPSALLPRLAEAYQGMVEVAKKEGITICVENEYSTNVATSAESVALLQKVPGLMLNWDPQNSLKIGEKDVFPQGYSRLPKNRILNVQAKAEGLIGPGEPVDWKGIFQALDRDGYQGCIGLETHTHKSKAENLAASHRCIERMLEISGEKS